MVTDRDAAVVDAIGRLQTGPYSWPDRSCATLACAVAAAIGANAPDCADVMAMRERAALKFGIREYGSLTAAYVARLQACGWTEMICIGRPFGALPTPDGPAPGDLLVVHLEPHTALAVRAAGANYGWTKTSLEPLPGAVLRVLRWPSYRGALL